MPTPKFDLGRAAIATIPARCFWDEEFKLFTPDGNGVVDADTVPANYTQLAATDEVRFRLFDGDDTVAIIVADDQNPSGNGTTVTIDDKGDGSTVPARVTVKFAATDLNIAPKDYGFVIDIKDVSDGNRYQPACFGTIRIVASPT